MEPKYKYRIIHSWLNKHYGKADKCENENCKGKSNVFEYCLRQGKPHERNRDNYIMMCRSCHRRYDMYDKNPHDIAKPIAGKYNQNLYLGPISVMKPVILLPDQLYFASGKELADHLGADKSSVYMVLSGKRKSLYGKKIVYASN